MPRHNARQFASRIARLGFVRIGHGRHEKWHNPRTNRMVVISRHGSKTFGPGMMSKMLRDAGLTVEQYLADELDDEEGS